jgi:hypothetical protein
MQNIVPLLGSSRFVPLLCSNNILHFPTVLLGDEPLATTLPHTAILEIKEIVIKHAVTNAALQSAAITI